MTRAEVWAIRKQPTPMPDVGGDVQIMAAFNDLGHAQSMGFGLAVLPWTEIDAYARRVDLDFGPWEYRALRQMSAAFISGLTAGKEIMCKSPELWDDEDED